MESGPLKVSFVGEGSVGKSTLVIRFVHDHFIPIYDPTIEDVYSKQVTLKGAAQKVELFDTTDPFNCITNFGYGSGFRTSSGVVYCYSIADRWTFEELYRFKDIVNDGQLIKPFPHTEFLFALKLDLASERQVTEAEGRALAAQWGVPYFELSAKTPLNVDSAIMQVLNATQDFVDAEKGKVTEQPRSYYCSLL